MSGFFFGALSQNKDSYFPFDDIFIPHYESIDKGIIPPISSPPPSPRQSSVIISFPIDVKEGYLTANSSSESLSEESDELSQTTLFAIMDDYVGTKKTK